MVQPARTSKADIVSLKEFFDTRFNHIEEMFRRSEEAQKEALVIASQETERRLEILNGEAGRLRQMQATYVPRETHDLFRKEILSLIAANRIASETAVAQIMTAIEDLKLSRATLAGKASQSGVIVAMLFAATGTGIGLVGLLLSLFKVLVGP